MVEQGEFPGVNTFTQVATAYGKEGNIAAMMDTIVRMREAGLRPNAITYTAALRAVAQSQGADAAREV